MRRVYAAVLCRRNLHGPIAGAVVDEHKMPGAEALMVPEERRKLSRLVSCRYEADHLTACLGQRHQVLDQLVITVRLAQRAVLLAARQNIVAEFLAPMRLALRAKCHMTLEEQRLLSA